MKYKKENYLVDRSFCYDNNVTETGLNGISGENGQFAYFVTEKDAFNYVNVLNNTIRRIELLLETIEIDISDETSYNELEVIHNELKNLIPICDK